MKEAGKTQFALNLYKWSETTGILFFTSYVIPFNFILLYADLTQRDPAWKATVKTTGLDFDIEFIKPFDINDKSMWVRSEFASTAYSTERANGR